MKHQIHSVQTFVRVIYTDGVVAGIMAPSAEVNPSLDAQHDIQASAMLNQQSRNILDQFAHAGPDGLYEAAVASTQQVSRKHEAPQPKPPEE